jgi:hypothetical protein
MIVRSVVCRARPPDTLMVGRRRASAGPERRTVSARFAQAVRSFGRRRPRRATDAPDPPPSGSTLSKSGLSYWSI